MAMTPIHWLKLAEGSLERAREGNESQNWIKQTRMCLRHIEGVNPDEYPSIDELQNLVDFYLSAYSSQEEPTPRTYSIWDGAKNMIQAIYDSCRRKNNEIVEIDEVTEQPPIVQPVRNQKPVITVDERPKERPLNEEPIIKIYLDNARQYDMAGDRPPACTFHAMQAIETISSDSDFALYRELLEEKSPFLSTYQKSILEAGLRKYETQGDRFQGGADIEQIPRHLYPNVQVREKQIVVATRDTLRDDIQNLVDQLFKCRAVILKNFKDETSSLIRKGEDVIFFDSHKNKMILARGKDAVSGKLYSKLRKHVGELNTFEYASIS